MSEPATIAPESLPAPKTCGQCGHVRGGWGGDPATCGLSDGLDNTLNVLAAPPRWCKHPLVVAERALVPAAPPTAATMAPKIIFDERGLRIVAVPGQILPGFDGRGEQRGPGQLRVECFAGRDAMGAARWEPANPSTHRACAIAFNALVRRLNVPAWAWSPPGDPFEVSRADDQEACPDCGDICERWMREGHPCGESPF